MATNFPGSLDSFTNPTSGSTLDSPSHAAQHSNINDAMEAVQAKLGTGAGTIGEYTTFTTTATGISINNQNCVYAQVNEIVFAHYYVVFSSAATADIKLSLPVDMGGWSDASRAGAFQPGLASDASGSNYTMWPCRDTSSNSLLRFFAMDWGAGFSTVGVSTPFTWASSDSMRFSITYTAA